MHTFKDHVVLIPKVSGGAWLVDLAGQCYALTDDAIHDARRIAGGFTTDNQKLIAEFEAHDLLVSSGRRWAWLSQLRTKLVDAAIHLLLNAATHWGQFPDSMTSRLMSVVCLCLRFAHWPTVVQACIRHAALGGMGQAALARRSVSEISELVVRVASKHLLPVRCKERALTAYLLCRFAGFPAKIHVGCTPNVFQLHCWVASQGTIVGDDESICNEFNTIATFG